MAEGYSTEQIAKIWGGNSLRVLQEGWGQTEQRSCIKIDDQCLRNADHFGVFFVI